MRFSWNWAGPLLVAIAALLCSWMLAVPLKEVFQGPIQTILGSERELNSRLLDISEYSQPLEGAGRRLLKPFGVVRLVRTFSFPPPRHSQKSGPR